MKFCKKLLLICYLTILTAVVSAQTETAQSRGLVYEAAVGTDVTVGKQWAVFIAIDRYQEWGPLHTTVRDAMAIRDILLENYYIDEVRELYDQAATAAGIRRLFTELSQQVGLTDSVFVYYAGHGYTDHTNTGFWIPSNGGKDVMDQNNWIPNTQIRNMLTLLPAKHVFLVSDSCFSGDLLDGKRGTPVQIDSNYYRQAYSKTSRQVMTSGSSEGVPEPSEFSMRLKSALLRAEGVCIDPEYLFTTGGVREVNVTQPLLGPIGGEHQEGGSFLFFRKQTAAVIPQDAVTPQVLVTPQVSTAVGSVTVTSEIAGEILIDGRATGTSIKEGGTVTVNNVGTGNTGVAVRLENGTIINASGTVIVQQGQTVTAAILRPVPDNMVRIEGGTFMMGSPASEPERIINETWHQVTVSSFYMGKYQVTQREYREVMGTNPSYFKGDNLPVEQVSWYDAVVYCNKLSIRENLTPAYSINGKTNPDEWGTTPVSENAVWDAVIMVNGSNGYRLPTEAQWEYACRAGTTTPFNTGNNITTSDANYNGNYPYNNNANGTYRERTTAVGSFAPNPWGLYDMHGNVWEWCWDWYGNYQTGTQTNPPGASSGSYRVERGGSWGGSAQVVRSAFRYGNTPSIRDYYLGFRLVHP